MEVVELMESSSAQDQMEMMTMMKQLNKLPGLLGPSSDPSTIFHNNPSTTSNAAAALTTNSPFSSAPFLGTESSILQKRNSMEAMREMIFGIAAMQPIQIDPESVKPRKRKNMKISKDPQSVAARHRRERISEKLRIMQRLVPGGTKMDTASMLEEAIHYLKFLKKQVHSLEQAAAASSSRPLPVGGGVIGFLTSSPNYVNYSSSLVRSCQLLPSQMVGSAQILG